MDIVINRCFGGFGLSIAACKRYEEITGIKVVPSNYFNNDDLEDEYYTTDGEFKPGVVYCGYLKRDDPILALVVRELGAEVDTSYSDLVVITIPDGVDWFISNYDGIETIEEVHRSWC